MDALILSCGTGGGHNSAGKAIMEELKRRGHHVVMKNPYTLKSTRLSGGIDQTYIKTVQNIPKVFGAVYKIGNLYRRLPFRSPVYFVNRPMNAVMQKYLEENHFDIVIMPHLFPGEILTNMKKHRIEIPKTIFVATDYVCTPFTEEIECDAYVVPSEDLKDDFVKRGLPRENLYALGIPTAGCFSKIESREEAKERLGLAPDKKYILIAGGSMGGGKMEHMIGKLQSHFADYRNVELIVVCGSNRTLSEKLQEHPAANRKVIDFTDDMASYIKASHVFITKPGGLSSTEAAVCGVPILHTFTIPGCESFNARYFSSRGMSADCENFGDLIRHVEELLKNEEAANHMIARQKVQISAHAAADICDLAERLVGKQE